MAELKLAKSYTITNILAEDVKTDTVWNTGLSACGCPHIDENIEDAGKSLVKDTSEILPKINKNQIAVAIYDNNNQYLVLNPGDKVTVTAETDEASLFYLDQAVEGALTVVDSSEAPAEDTVPSGDATEDETSVEDPAGSGEAVEEEDGEF